MCFYNQAKGGGAESYISSSVLILAACRTAAHGKATAEPSPALCTIGSSGLVSPRTRFQLALAHNALVSLINALYLIFKFAVMLWQSFDHDVCSLRHVQASRACRKQPLADLEFVLTHNRHPGVRRRDATIVLSTSRI